MRPGKGERAVRLLAALGKSACYLALFLGMQVAVMLPVAIAVGVQAALGEGPVDFDLFYLLIEENAMTLSLISGVLTAAAVVVFYLLRRKRLSEALWLRGTPASTLWTGAALAPGLYLVVTVVLLALPAEWTERYNEAASGLDTGGLLGVLAVAVVAPVVEEFIFRGLIMTRLERAMPGWVAVLLSAAIFGACHGNPVWFGYAFVLGAVFGWIDLRAGSIWPSILGHVAFNSIGQVFALMPESEDGMTELAALVVLLLAGILAPMLDRKGVAALFRRRPKVVLEEELPTAPGNYEFDPWEE